MECEQYKEKHCNPRFEKVEFMAEANHTAIVGNGGPGLKEQIRSLADKTDARFERIENRQNADDKRWDRLLAAVVGLAVSCILLFIKTVLT